VQDPSNKQEQLEADSEHAQAKAWLAELLKDNPPCPGARGVLAVDPDDSPEFAASLREEAHAEHHLVRRGQDHGHWLELRERGGEQEPKARFSAAEPILLPRHFDPQDLEPEAGLELLQTLSQQEDFLAWSTELAGRAGFSCQPDQEPLKDPARDCCKLSFQKPGAARTWAKASMLSDFPSETSMRLRLSAGREPEDEGNRDLPTLRTVAELGQALLPGMKTVARDAPLQGKLTNLLGSPPLLTQAIAYWNTPGGGALFHHDAFDEPLIGGQRGVCFVQAAGRSAWLALSSQDLAHEVLGFLRELLSGDWHHLEEELIPNAAARTTLIGLASDPEKVIDQLILPGCGQLAAIVNLAPTFTAQLADRGHALVLDPGDVLLLPNQGLRKTLLHSVFCASNEATYGLSMAIRESQPVREFDQTVHRLGAGRKKSRSGEHGSAKRNSRGRGRRPKG